MTIRTCVALLVLIAMSPMLVGCKATAESARDNTQLSTMLPATRIDPPRPGQNSIWVEWQDQTGQGIDLYNDVVRSVEEMGYRAVNDFEAADYALWATLRIFDRVDSSFDERVAGLGGIAGGIAAGTAIGQATGNWGYGTAGGVAAGGLAAAGIAALTRQNEWAMVVDIQLGRRVEGGVETGQTSSRDADAIARTGMGTGMSAEGGRSVDEQTRSQAFTETRARFELEQRIMARTGGTRMDRPVALDAMLPRLRNALSAQLPRAR